MKTTNLTSKNIREFTPKDTLYIHKPNANGKEMSVLYLCSFVSFQKKQVTGKILGKDNTSKIKESQEQNKEISAPLQQCSLYGISNPEDISHPHHHYFDLLGHAYLESAEVKHLRLPRHHPSYGMLSIRKTQNSHPKSCFGSPLLHQSTVRN